MIFHILRILREPVRTKLPNGYLIEESVISIFPIFSPIDAEDAVSALRLAGEIYPNFRHHIAVQEALSYEQQQRAIQSAEQRPLHPGSKDSQRGRHSPIGPDRLYQGLGNSLEG